MICISIKTAIVLLVGKKCFCFWHTIDRIAFKNATLWSLEVYPIVRSQSNIINAFSYIKWELCAPARLHIRVCFSSRATQISLVMFYQAFKNIVDISFQIMNIIISSILFLTCGFKNISCMVSRFIIPPYECRRDLLNIVIDIYCPYLKDMFEVLLGVGDKDFVLLVTHLAKGIWM